MNLIKSEGPTDETTDEPTMVAFNPTREVRVVERDGGWKVVPGIADTSRGEELAIIAPEEYSLLVFMVDPRVSGGRQQFFIPKGRADGFEVSSDGGIYPYLVIVQTAKGPVVAEGNSMPIIRVDY